MSQFLDDFAGYIRKNKWNVLHIAEIKDGGEPEEYEVIPSNPCQDFYSVAKAFTVAAVGILFDRGLLTPSSRIADLLANEWPTDIDPRWNTVTVHMALKHRIGLPRLFLDIDCKDATAFGDDYLRYLLTAPLVYTPGEDAMYSDAAFYLLARVVTRLAGEKMDDLLWRTLFCPLRFREAAWSHCPKGHPMGGTGLYCRASDAVKLGEVFRTDGCYHGQRILSETWCRLVKENSYEIHPLGFGSLYGKGGMRGQMLLVDPDKNRAIAWNAVMSGEDNQSLLRFIADYNN